MASIRLKAPFGATAISIAGVEYEVEEGFVTLPEIYKDVAESHGYGKSTDRLDLDQQALDKVSDLTMAKVGVLGRGDLLVYCDEHKIEVPPRTSLNDLRSMVWEHAQANQKKLPNKKAQAA